MMDKLWTDTIHRSTASGIR